MRLAILLLSLVCSSALAHPFVSDYGFLQQTAAGRYHLTLDLPVTAGAHALPSLKGSPGVTIAPESRTLSEDGFGEDHWRYEILSHSDSPELTLSFLGKENAQLILSKQNLKGESSIELLNAQHERIRLQADGSPWQTAVTFLGKGMWHVLSGTDHLLFILGIFLLSPSLRELLSKVTLFTLAHSITLSLAVLGFVTIPAPPVEAGIALSILYVCFELSQRRNKSAGHVKWVIFSFGLLHGLGFSSALTAGDLPQASIPLILGMFNLGVEAGQLLFISAMGGVLTLLRHLRPLWFNTAERGLVVFMGCSAAFWFFQRLPPIFF
ncbi:HupE/UreJ family protein [Dongshaea marina]|uniref:HupE/UreJ family protein n=1 Tax=Dongshaea marina TaxID=2047966 RepID=UPI000D3E03D6|nr:HupE/UreJ family protein [Dongshaea marina]